MNEPLDLLREGKIKLWNAWRFEHQELSSLLRGVDLRGLDLRGAVSQAEWISDVHNSREQQWLATTLAMPVCATVK